VMDVRNAPPFKIVVGSTPVRQAIIEAKYAIASAAEVLVPAYKWGTLNTNKQPNAE